MKSVSTSTVLSIAIVVVGFWWVFVLSDFVEARRPPLPPDYVDQDLALQGARLKNYSLGFDGLIADWYWMQALQYVGNKFVKSGANIDIEDLRPLNVRLLYPYLDNATTLDPQFMVAYSYGAVVLPSVDPEQAIKLAEKGIAANPGAWRLYQHLGFIYWRLGQYEKASEVYDAGYRISGESFMLALSASMKNKGGDRDTARMIYRQMYDSAQDSQTKDQAWRRLLEMDSLDERDGVRKALAGFKERHGRCASGWSELIPFLRRIELPHGLKFRFDKDGRMVDPSDAPYTFDPSRCDVLIDPKVSRVPVA